jgi:polyisoprenoid-binding protein YceI
MRTRFVPALALLLAAAPVTALAADWKLDPAHTSVIFAVEHLELVDVYGRFNDVEGTATFDPESPEDAAVSITIQTASVDTANEDRDKHLRNDDFLNVPEYPTMSFESTAWEQKEEDLYHVTGNFTLYGTTKEITVPVEFAGVKKGMRGETRAGFEAEFTIDRTEYGMDKMVGPVGAEIEIILAVEFIQE